MMVHAMQDLPPNASLPELLGARARRSPMDRLVIDLVGGALVAGAALWARPGGAVLIAAVGLCFASYGAWAIAERRLDPLASPDRLAREGWWRAVHVVAAVTGLAAFVLLLFAALGLALGTIKS